MKYKLLGTVAALATAFSVVNPVSAGSCQITQLGAITTGAVLDTDGQVWMWGFRNAGISGTASPTHAYSNLKPVNRVEFPAGTKITQLVSGAYHFLALTEDGRVYGWGQSGYGEVGCRNAVNDPYVRPPCEVPFPGLKAGDKIARLAAGEYFSMATTAEGDVYTWGHDLYGQGGRGANVASNPNGPVRNVNHPSYSNGKVVPVNNDSMQFVPYKVNLNGEPAVVSGAWYEGAMAITLGATGEAHVWGWGDNEAAGLGVPYTCGGTPIRGVQCVVRTPTRANSALENLAPRIQALHGGNAFATAMLAPEPGASGSKLAGWGQLAALGLGVTSTGKAGDTTAATTIPLWMPLKDPVTGVEHLATNFFSRYVGNVAIGNDNRLWVWGQGGGSAFPQIYPARPTPHGTPSTYPADTGLNSALRSDQAGATLVGIGSTKEVVYYQMSDGSAFGLGYASVDSLNPIGIPGAGKLDLEYWGPTGWGGTGTMHGTGSLESIRFGGVRLFGPNNGGADSPCGSAPLILIL
ncbi:MAG TPA: hypothetical protein VFW84_15060 [Aquabacterium sp.]|uniref:hypothetical protein n=1 Tax=Aquabacterium sp. TaxID=1872578 RepID=UPI002E348B48|nr:hypothetical protein [Aquabacterium sp.]HEX5374045.1 hypothetical protein [Aquabacterium sp.]